jgi:hypothetical protein
MFVVVQNHCKDNRIAERPLGRGKQAMNKRLVIADDQVAIRQMLAHLLSCDDCYRVVARREPELKL